MAGRRPHGLAAAAARVDVRLRLVALLPLVAGCVGLVADVAAPDGAGQVEEGIPDAAIAVDDAGFLNGVTDAAVDAAVADAAVGAPDASLDAGWPVFIVGMNPSGFARSRDGHTWTELQTLARGDAGVVSGDNAVTGLAFGLGLVVAVGDSGISVSRDGKTWSLVYPGRLHASVVAFGLDRFVVLSGDLVLTSTDGLAWQPITGTGDATHWHTLDFGVVGGVAQFVAVGDQWEFLPGAPDKAPHRLKRSFDGLAWDYLAAHRDTPEGDAQIDQAVIGNGLAVALSSRQRAGIGYVYDGTNWTSWTPFLVATDAGGAVDLSGIAFHDGRFVAVGGAQAESGDGLRWAVSQLTIGDGGLSDGFPPRPSYGGLTWAGDRLMGPFPFHVDAWLAESPDGVAWVARWRPTTEERAFGEPSVLRFGRVAAP